MKLMNELRGTRPIGTNYLSEALEPTVLTNKSDGTGRVRFENLVDTEVVIELESRSMPKADSIEFKQAETGSFRSSPFMLVEPFTSIAIKLGGMGSIRGRIDPVQYSNAQGVGEVILRNRLSQSGSITVEDLEARVPIRPNGRFEFESVIPGDKSLEARWKTGKLAYSYAVAATSVREFEAVDVGELSAPDGTLDIEVEVLEARSKLPISQEGVTWHVVVSTNPDVPGPKISTAHEVPAGKTLKICGLQPGTVYVGCSLSRGVALSGGYELLHRMDRDKNTRSIPGGKCKVIYLATRVRSASLVLKGPASAKTADAYLLDIEEGAVTSARFKLDDSGRLTSSIKVPSGGATYDIDVWSPNGKTGYLGNLKTMVKPDAIIDIPMVPAAAVRLAIVDKNGDAVSTLAGFQTAVFATASVHPANARFTRADRQGRATLRGLKPETKYSIRFAGVGKGHRSAPPFEIVTPASGETKDLGRVVGRR